MNKIAVIGLSCLFPGAKNPEQYWQNLIEQKDLTSFATAEQMGVDANIFYDPAKGATDKYYCLRGGYIRDFQFDATGYAIAPETLLSLDKLYQWSLYVSKQALHDSGYLENRSVLADCGVILGNLSFPTRYSRELFAPIYQEIFNATLGELLQQESFQLPSFASSSSVSLINAAISGYPAALIAQALSLSGGHFSLDAACASSLYAVKLACDRLLSGKADLMLAGAISGADPFFINMGFSIFQAFPDDGVTRPLDQSSKGLLAAEGAGMLVLKRYDDAVRDGDRIYATISGIGLSNDGKGKFVLSPNSKGQILAFDRAYRNAGITPETIDYVECHATGTPVGDTTELNSMQTFFGESLPLMGSVKSNFGHLLTAAGIAGLIKVILSMSQETIPATIHVSEPIHPNIITNTIFWNYNHSTKRAAINAFGFGGTNAHLILEEAEDTSQSPIQNPKSKIQNRIAIVGMDALFGSCAGLEAFDRTIYEAKQHFIPLPPQRWQGAEEFPQLLKAYGLETGKAPPGAYIQAFEMDFFRFKIPPSDDDRLIPQQLLMLKVADQAIRDAGLQPGGNVAVIVAMGTELALHQYRARCDLSWQLKQSLASANRGLPPAQVEQLETLAKNSLHQPAQVNQYTSFIGNTMASRISALWDFSGASFTLSAEENSVFRALETAQLLLANGEVDAVVVGAIDLAGGLEPVLLHARMAPINQGSNTLSFDRHANGWMVGEGAGAVVLKRYDTAKAGNDRIYAVIDAISSLQDNTIASFPNPPSSSTVKQTCLAAFDKAGIDATEIGYLEVCGSGIAREDAAEIEGLNLAYQSAKLSSQARLSCCIGSVKANMGHTYAAAGMASLIKTALCLYHRYIPATPQWSGPKMPECWQASPFYVATRSKTWFLPTSASKRVAAINGLGLDGTYAHVILSEDMSQTERSSSYLEQRSFHLFPLAAHCQSDLRSQIEQLKQTIENDHDLATTASQTFTTFQQQTQATYTLAIVGHNKQEVLRELNSAIAGIHQAFTTGEDWKTPLGSYFTAHPLGKQGKVAFVYPGMGSSDLDVGRDIFRLFPNIYETFSTITPNVGEVLHETLLYSRSLEKPSKIDQTANLTQFLGDGVAMCQSGISLAVLYTLIIRDYFRVQPQITFGYSLGEASSMMFALGIWRDDRNLSQVLASSPMFKTELCGSCLEVNRFLNLPQTDEYPVDKLWTSYLLIAPVSTVREAIEPENFVYLTFINTPKEVVIAGDPNGCLRVIKQLNCDSFQIDFNSVLHCEITQSKYDELVNLHSIPIYSAPNIQFYSALTAVPLLLDSKTLAHNAAKLCCQTVDFPKIVNRVYDDGARIFLELGSSNNCSRWIRETLNGKEHIAMSINTKGVDDHTGIIRVLAKLISHCVPVDLSPLYQPVSQTADKVRSLIKTITLGGNRIRSEILTAENRKNF